MPRIMQEPGHVLDVIDAFDTEVGDDFDLSVSLGFEYHSKRARILRESSYFDPGLSTGNFTARTMAVAQYIETTSRLIPQLDVGLYRDLAVYLRVPVVLSNSRRLDDLDGTAGNVNSILGGAPGELLFNLPFQAPDRSGVEYLGVGANLNIFNQARDRTKPTWLIGIEARIAVGEPMHACTTSPATNADGGRQLECADPGDIDRDGIHDPDNVGAGGLPLETSSPEERGPGITRGTIGLELHSYMSKRIKYIEPYGGFAALFEFPMGTTDYDATDLEGSLVNLPPIVGTVTVGMMIHPWENRQAFGRLTFDLRFDGEYHSEGRNYSELFDALGSSAAASLRNPRWAAFRDACPGGTCDPKSIVDTSSQKTYFTGLTAQEGYGSYRSRGAVTWQASEYVRLTAGLGLRFDQAHGITAEQPCNPSFKDDVGRSGPCHSANVTADVFGISATGIPNPAYRPSINSVGRRFYVDNSVTYEVFASGVVMF